MRKVIATLLVIGLTTFIVIFPVAAQDTLQVKCGEKLPDLFNKKLVYSEFKKYSIKLQSGMILEVRGLAVGTTLKFGIGIFDAADQLIGASEKASTAPSAKTGIVSASLDHYVLVGNHYGLTWTDLAAGVGDFSLEFKCYGSDGKEIRNADIAEKPTNKATPPPAQQLPANTRGFPGLPAISFEDIEAVPLDLGQPEGNTITTKSTDIKAYEFEAKAGAVMDLSFVRKSGNLSLGLVVLSGDNKVVYQVSLVTASAMTVKFILPTAGKYTLGIFKVDLLPIAQPSATKFEIIAKLL